ncbi:MAG: primosomal protein N' [Rhodospirillaceae bacterium]|nr:primosomal protein N' [Rhodospirillaceae bacterium]
MPGEVANSTSGPGPDGPRRAAVLLPLPLAGAYDYALPAGLAVADGDYVIVPLGNREVMGVVWGQGDGAVDDSRLRPVAMRLDLPPLPAVSRRFVDWVAAYTMVPPGAVLRMTMSVSAALEPPRAVTAYTLADPMPEAQTLSPARHRVLAVLAEGPPRLGAELARDAGVSPGLVRTMAAAGQIRAVALAADPPWARPDPDRAGPDLTADQQAAADSLRRQVADGGYGATLLDGVTGSGKTEVYFEAIAAALAGGRQVLVLLPEIALSAQWLGRFAARFGVAPAEWHSDLAAGLRRRTWRAVLTGAVRVVVGARSALFLPFPDLGLIVVDEEHEAAFKQEDGVLYHARDMAVARAHLGDIPIILASATPSLETVVNADTGRYRRLALPDRHGGAALPAITAVDLRTDPPERGRFLSPPLIAAIRQTLEAGEQAMLFLNRRGYAPLTLCRACGHRMGCPDCTSWLVEHRLTRRLLCHHCGYTAPLPSVCPGCGAANSFVAVGPGVERIAEEADHLFPDARWLVVTSDTLTGPKAAETLVRQVHDREIDLLIGTQMIAKGHHFPWLTCVGVVDADLGLAGGDLRAAERTYQVLHQVAGRAGRSDRAGRALLQTFDPRSPVIEALVRGDRDGFLAEEAAARRARGWPPFGRLAALIVTGHDAALVDRVAADLARAAPRGPDIDVLGPAPAPLALLRGRHRRRLLVKAARRCPVQAHIARWLARVPVPGTVRVTVDIDPYSFL